MVGVDTHIHTHTHTHTHTQATVVSDIVVLYVLKARHFYRRKKYQDVVDPIEGYEPIEVDNSSTGGDNLINNPTGSISSKKSDQL